MRNLNFVQLKLTRLFMLSFSKLVAQNIMHGPFSWHIISHLIEIQSRERNGDGIKVYTCKNRRDKIKKERNESSMEPPEEKLGIGYLYSDFLRSSISTFAPLSQRWRRERGRKNRETVKIVSKWSTREHKAKIYGKWKNQYTFLLDRRRSSYPRDLTLVTSTVANKNCDVSDRNEIVHARRRHTSRAAVYF